MNQKLNNVTKFQAKLKQDDSIVLLTVPANDVNHAKKRIMIHQECPECAIIDLQALVTTVDNTFTTTEQNARNIYRLMFGREFDDPKRKQHPLPINYALSVALYRFSLFVKYKNKKSAP